MGFKDLLSGLLAPAAEAYKARTVRKQELEKQAHEGDMAAEKAWHEWRVLNITSDAAWEAEAQRQSGWKDELWSVGFFSVFIGSFIPVVQDYVKVGIAQISDYPTWFQILLGTVVLAAFGIRYLRR